MKNINFWPYDIFGYFVPGLVLLYSALMTNDKVQAVVPIDKFASTSGTNYVLVLIWGFLIYVGGHIVASLSSNILERALVNYFFKFPTDWFFFIDKEKYWFRRWVINLIGLDYCEPYSSEFKELFWRKYKKTFSISAKQKSDVFWLCQEWLPLAHPAAYKNAMHFLELYGLSRNTCMSFIMIMLLPYLPGWNSTIPSCLWMTVSLAIAYFLFSNYLKLLRRMNDMVFRGFVASVVKGK